MANANFTQGKVKFIMNDRRFAGVPKLLETPKGDDGITMDRKNLKKLRAMVK